MNMFNSDAAKAYAEKRKQEEKENNSYSWTWGAQVCNFSRLKKALEKSITAALKEIWKYAKAEKLPELCEHCESLLSPDWASITLFYDALTKYEEYPDPEDIADGLREVSCECYYEDLPFEYEFVADRMEPFATTLTVWPEDDLIFRLGAFLPDIENADLWSASTSDKNAERVDGLVSSLRGYLEVWDNVHNGTHCKTGKGTATFGYFEVGMLRLLDMQNQKRQQGARATKMNAKKTAEKIIAKALELDPKKERTANSLAQELEAHFKVRRSKIGKSVSGKPLMTKDTSYSPRGLKKSNIRSVLKENGWQQPPVQRLSF